MKILASMVDCNVRNIYVIMYKRTEKNVFEN